MDKCCFLPCSAIFARFPIRSPVSARSPGVLPRAQSLRKVYYYVLLYHCRNHLWKKKGGDLKETDGMSLTVTAYCTTQYHTFDPPSPSPLAVDIQIGRSTALHREGGHPKPKQTSTKLNTRHVYHCRRFVYSIAILTRSGTVFYPVLWEGRSQRSNEKIVRSVGWKAST